MAVPDFGRLALPQDMTLVDASGRVSPAWYRVLAAFVAVYPKLIQLGETVTSNDAAANAAIAAGDAALDARITAILGQAAVSDAATTTLTISAGYDQLEIQALETRVRDQAATINTLIARLEAAGILEG